MRRDCGSADRQTDRVASVLLVQLLEYEIFGRDDWRLCMSDRFNRINVDMGTLSLAKKYN
jgi:hypothetical protein